MARKHGTRIVAASVCAIVIAGSAFAQGYGAPNGQGRQGGRTAGTGAGMGRMRICPATTLMPPAARMFQFMSAQLALTADQSAKITQLSLDFTKNTEKAQADAAKANRALTDALKTGCADVDKLNALAKDGLKAEEPIVKAETQFWAEFNKTLTEDQRTTFWTAYAQMLQGGGQGRNGAGFGGQGRNGGGYGRRGGGAGGPGQDGSTPSPESTSPAAPPAPEQ